MITCIIYSATLHAVSLSFDSTTAFSQHLITTTWQERILTTSFSEENYSGFVDGSHFLWSQCFSAIGSGHQKHAGCRFIFSLLLTQIKCRFIKLWNILSSQGFNKGLPNLKNLLWFKLLSDVLLIILNESLGWLWCLWANIEISWKSC